MGSMKMQDYLILGVGAFLAYKVIKGDIDKTVQTTEDKLNPFNYLPQIDLGGMFSGITMPAFELNPNFLSDYYANNPTQQTRDANQSAIDANKTANNKYVKTGLPPILEISLPGYKGNYNVPTQYQGIAGLGAPRLSDYADASRRGMLPSMPEQTAARWDARNLAMGQTAISTDVAQAYVDSGAYIAYEGGLFMTAEQYLSANKTSDAGTTVFQRSAEQQAYINARSHLGTPIGTPGSRASTLAPNSVLGTTNGNYVVTDESGNVVHDTGYIINETARQEAINKLKGK